MQIEYELQPSGSNVQARYITRVMFRDDESSDYFLLLGLLQKDESERADRSISFSASSVGTICLYDCFSHLDIRAYMSGAASLEPVESPPAGIKYKVIDIKVNPDYL